MRLNNSLLVDRTWLIFALWAVLVGAAVLAFADEPPAREAPLADAAAQPTAAPQPVASATPEAPPEQELSAEAQQLVEGLQATLAADSEARQMLDAILQGSQLGPGEGWFKTAVCQSRHTWDAVRQRYDANQDGAIQPAEFAGAESDFARLDRNCDQTLTDADFPTADSGIPRTPGAMLFYQADADGNGKLTRDEFVGLFDRWNANGAEFLSLDEVSPRLNPPDARGRKRDDGPSQEVLIRGLAQQEIGSLQSGPALEEAAPDFTLSTVEGQETVTLSQKIGRRPVVLIFGNFTCGPFRNQAGNIEQLYRRYRDRAEFLMIYVREAHPRDGWRMESNDRRGVDIVQPATYDERVAVAGQCQERLALETPLLVDTIDDAVGARYSGMPSRLYLIDREGRIAFKSGRGPFGFQPAALEQALLFELAASPTGK